VIEQPGQGQPPLLLTVLNVGEVGGVGAQQVMYAMPIRVCGLHQVRPGQQVQQVLGLLEAGLGECCGSIRVEVGAGVQPEQPERPRRLDRQVQVGPGEHRTDRGARVTTGASSASSRRC
jgi:hypothetical protein